MDEFRELFNFHMSDFRFEKHAYSNKHTQVWSMGCCNRETRPSMLYHVVAIIMNDAIIIVLLIIENDWYCWVTMHVCMYKFIGIYVMVLCMESQLDEQFEFM